MSSDEKKQEAAATLKKATVYMQLPNINGTVSAKGHEKWVEVHDLHFATKRNISNSTGAGMDREHTKPSVTEVTFKKFVDQTSPELFSQSCTGAALATAKFDVCQTGSNLSPYLQFTFSNAIVSGYQIDSTANEDGRPMEVVKLSVTKVETRFTPYDDQHKAKSPTSSSYDLTTAVTA